MEVLPLCNLQPLATQHNEFSKYLPPILSAWQLGVLYEQRHSPPHFAPLPIAVAAEGHSCLEQWPLMQGTVPGLRSGDVAMCVTKQFTITSCPTSQMALQLPCTCSLSPWPALDGPREGK